MPHPRLRRPYRAVLAALLLLMGAAAGCGQSAPAGEDPESLARMDEALRAKLPADVRERGILRIGTDASYAPMSSFGPDGRTIIGMEPDLGEALGRVLGLKVRFVNTDFTRVVPDVAHRALDLGMTAMTDTPERAQKVDFVNYFSAGTSILVQRGNPQGITDVKDLCGKVVAVEKGTTQVDLLSRAQANCATERIDMQTYPTNSDALVELRTGRAGAVLNDLPPAAFLVNDSRTKAYYQLASTTQYEPGLYGIVVAKDRPDLRDAIQGATEELLHSGIYAEVLDRWGVADGAVDEVSINSGR
ncbi:MAG: ABC transporter substrate-binding protein [Nocardioides sp.]